MSAFSQSASTMRPSTPAVLRPALSSVTRRTLNNALARERSISFCRLRTFFRSPALLAVKIRCRSRRTSSSTCRQSTASQSRTASSGPFTVTASNLSLGSGVCVPQVVTGSPDPRQLPFGPGRHPYPTSYPEDHPAEVLVGRSPVSCRLSAVGIRFLGHPAPAGELEPSSRSAYRHTVIRRAGPQRGCRVAHEQDATGQGAPFTPRTMVRSRPAAILRPAPAASQRPVPTAPLEHPIGGGHLHEASSGVHSRSPITPTAAGGHPRGREAPRFPPVFSSPAATGWNKQRLRLRPRASHPAVTRDARRGGDGPSRTGPGTTPRPQPPSIAPPTSLMHPHVAHNPRWPP